MKEFWEQVDVIRYAVTDCGREQDGGKKTLYDNSR